MFPATQTAGLVEFFWNAPVSRSMVSSFTLKMVVGVYVEEMVFMERVRAL